MNTIHKDVSSVRNGDYLSIQKQTRVVVSVRPATITAPNTSDQLPAVEFLHKSPHRPGVDYLRIAAGATVPVLIP